MATALELGRKGWAPYLRAARMREFAKDEAPDAEQHEERLRGRVNKAAGALKGEFGARRVFLFGSLAHSGWFADDSDVDLVVEGLSPDLYWKAWRKVEEMIEERPVDLIPYEDASESMKRAIRRIGIEL